MKFEILLSGTSLVNTTIAILKKKLDQIIRNIFLQGPSGKPQTKSCLLNGSAIKGGGVKAMPLRKNNFFVIFFYFVAIQK